MFDLVQELERLEESRDIQRTTRMNSQPLAPLPPRAEDTKASNSLASRQSATSATHATTDIEIYLALAAEKNGVTTDWIRQFVIDDFDLDCILTNDLPTKCISAHIQLHLEQQRAWRAHG